MNAIVVWNIEIRERSKLQYAGILTMAFYQQRIKLEKLKNRDLQGQMEQAVDKNETTNKKLGISEGSAHRLDQGCPILFLESYLPVCFRSNPSCN